MELEFKNYQKMVMSNLSSYLDCVNTSNNITTAWETTGLNKTYLLALVVLLPIIMQ